MNEIVEVIEKRECNSCTKCCEGWLPANINGHAMYPGKPCFFVEINKGCKIYNERPQDPCRTFSCLWIQENSMPDHFKPDSCGVIMAKRMNNGNPFFSIHKAPNSPTVEYLTWAIGFALSNNYNLLWNYDDKMSWIGNEEFSKQMQENHKECEGCKEFHWKWTIDQLDPQLIILTMR